MNVYKVKLQGMNEYILIMGTSVNDIMGVFKHDAIVESVELAKKLTKEDMLSIDKASPDRTAFIQPN